MKKYLLKKLKQYIKNREEIVKAFTDCVLKYRTFEHFRIVALVILIGFVGISGHMFHEAYLESHVGDQVVFIRSPEGALIQGSATGFEVKAPSGKVYTLTNAHVCELQKDGLVMVEEKNHSHRLIPVRVLEVYEKNDLCLLEGLAGYDGLTLGSESHIGQTAWAIGYPLGESMNVSSGRIKDYAPIFVSAEGVSPKECTKPNMKLLHEHYLFMELEVCVIVRDAIQTDLRIYPGNSGSPLVNVYGNVIGVVFAAQPQTAWGSAVPLSDVKDFLSAY